MELFDLLCKLSQAHGPSGDEGEIRETIAQLAKPFADEVRQDTLGNLIVRKKGNGASKTDENDSAETDSTKDEEQN